MCKVYTGYCGTSEMEHGLCACTVDNPVAKARGLSLRTGAQTMLYLPLVDVGENLFFIIIIYFSISSFCSCLNPCLCLSWYQSFVLRI